MPETPDADPFNLQRFVSAQEHVYPTVCAELQEGEKDSHWMWFIFPQIKGLGFSAANRFYAISSLEEATAYLRHPILGPRLVECTRLAVQIEGSSIRQIFGWPDYRKFHSSMTLFAHAAPENPLFRTALEKYFEGAEDPATIERL
jgi:uncharacterized protein (DUF1810 family)